MQLNNKTFSVVTLGCKVNSFESNNFVNQMIAFSCKQTDDITKADICIINTCCVTNKAVSKSKYFIQKAIRSKKTQLVVIVGCLPQLDANFIKNKKIGIILGSKHKGELVNVIKQYNGTLINNVDNFSKTDKFEKLGLQLFNDNTRAFLKIQDGCNYMCSYCIIPFVRGRQRSLAHTEVLNDINALIQHGYHEIVLTGVNTAGYYDGDNYRFYDLLKDINKVKGNFRVRISSVEPFQINHQIINLIAANSQRWCKHLHICLQSGSDHVLQQMHRKYTVEDFVNLCKYARRKIKNLAITTDVIVGFPTETNEDFNATINNLKKVKFANIHLFPYSSRPFTTASKLKNIVSDTLKKQRFMKIMDLNNQLQKDFLKKFVGQTVQVIFENSKEKDIQVGHSEYAFTVKVKTMRNLHKQLRSVSVTKLVDKQLFGQLV